MKSTISGESLSFRFFDVQFLPTRKYRISPRNGTSIKMRSHPIDFSGFSLFLNMIVKDIRKLMNIINIDIAL